MSESSRLPEVTLGEADESRARRGLRANKALADSLKGRSPGDVVLGSAPVQLPGERAVRLCCGSGSLLAGAKQDLQLYLLPHLLRSTAPTQVTSGTAQHQRAHTKCCHLTW